MVAVRLADDRRGRVPFALLGVLLLVSSASVTATLTARDGASTRPETKRAIDRAIAAAQTALEDAVKDAGRAAARRPLVEPANTTYGRVFDEPDPFRAYLRVRIHRAAARNLESVEGRAGSVRVRVSLPEPTDARTLRRAKERVRLTELGADGEFDTSLRARFVGLRLTVLRDGTVVDERRTEASVVVSTPVLGLHERVETYEARLNRGPLARGDGAGLGARLSARLYPIAWVRGYAQYGGAPIENVVANRHVAFATNGGVLGVQRSVFGRSDPGGRAAVSRAGKRVATADFRAGAGLSGGDWVDLLLDAGAEPSYPGIDRSGDRGPDERIRVGVDRTADTAFASLVAGSEGNALESAVDSAYRADVRLVTQTRPLGREPRPRTRLSGNWTRVSERTETTVSVEDAAGLVPSAPDGWERFDARTRRVVRRHRAVERWRRGDESRRVVHAWTERDLVGIALVGDAAPRTNAPDRPIEPAYERGGPLDGPNLADVPASAWDELVERRGGVDRIAARAVDGSLERKRRTVRAERPRRAENWVYADVATLREEVRAISTTVSKREVGTGGANAAAALADRVRERRAALVDAPTAYDGAADAARVAARAAYVDRVIADLEARANRTRTARRGLDDALRDAGVRSLERVDRIVGESERVRDPNARSLPTSGPEAAAALTVDGAPSYLTLEAVDDRRVAPLDEGETTHPLAARNLNVFTAPYGDAADTVVDELAGNAEGADVRTAALTLRAADRAAEATGDETDGPRTRLRERLATALDSVGRRTAAELASSTALTRGQAAAAVDDGLSRWETVHGRSLAAANGSAAAAVAAAAAERYPETVGTDRRRDWVRVRTRLALVEALRGESVRVPEPLVDETRAAARNATRKLATEAVERGASAVGDAAQERWFGETLGAIPSGLPVAPVPGYWYATLNAWHVEVEGEHARFAVRVPHGTPDDPSGTAYVRTRGTVTLDVDGDGERERLGRTTRVSFETETTVLVVVPAGGSGVGDTDGDADERSPGWSARRDNPI